MITLDPDDNMAFQMITFHPGDSISSQMIALAPDDNMAFQMITFLPR